MKNFIPASKKIFGKFPLSVKILLLCAMGRAFCIFTILPFLPIYLYKILGLNVEQVGYILGICLLFGTLASVYGGYLADRINKLYFMCYLSIGLSILFFALPIIHHIALVLLILILINTFSSSIGVTKNALFGELLSEEDRSEAFSLRYSLENIGAATGPFLGAWLIHFNINMPFFISGIFTVLIFILLLVFRNQFTNVSTLNQQSSQPLGFTKILGVLRLDKRLVLFTIGGILSMGVYGPLLTYLSQYLATVKTPSIAYQTIAYVSAVNAVIVIGLQYLIGLYIKKEFLMRWLTFGVIAFVIGLFSLSLSLDLLFWLIAISVFTIGELIIVPAEYMFIDSIAPSHLKGAYFGAQNLIFVGMAIGPILCGVLLAHTVPAIMFYVLISMIILSWILYYLGCKKGV